MSGPRPFDDGRFPDAEFMADCMICGRPVDPRDPHRGAYDEPPAGPKFPIHLPCLDTVKPEPQNGLPLRKHVLSRIYRDAIRVMSDQQLKRFTA